MLIVDIVVADENLLQFQRAEKLTSKKRRIRKQWFLHELIPSVSTCPWCAEPGWWLSFASVLQITLKSHFSSVALLITALGDCLQDVLPYFMVCLASISLSLLCTLKAPLFSGALQPCWVTLLSCTPAALCLARVTVGPGGSVLDSGALLWHSFHTWALLASCIGCLYLHRVTAKGLQMSAHGPQEYDISLLLYGNSLQSS